ncbi:alpha-ketoglutarate-dependent dioxygenase AlkB [Chryseobacterium contaminans]|uniref:2OG-Fe(II) oxygenase superfamily protein n=1 Tax=Chryseobacterium contaminans TaxID=1423959 RepID=A0A1M6VM00_9FLAO|nr:2OG-Fe(II) oxygenase superfamily protein [Chryseobacterium contaminans]
MLLDSGSLIVLSGDARYKWTHGIAPRKTDYINGRKIERKLRLSMTFRKVILQ